MPLPFNTHFLRGVPRSHLIAFPVANRNSLQAIPNALLSFDAFSSPVW